MDATNEPPQLIRRYVAFLARWKVSVVLGAFLLFVGAVYLTAKLDLRTDLTELLPANDPALVALQQMAQKVPSPTTLVVVVVGPDHQANEKFADALNDKLQPLMGKELRSVDYKTNTATPFFEHNKALFANLDDLQRVEEDFESFLLEKKNPAYVPLDDPEKDLRDLKKEVEDRGKTDGPVKFPNGYYEGEEHEHVLVMVSWTMSSGTVDANGFEVQKHVQQIIDDMNPRSFGDLQVRITGDVASGIEEHDAVKADIKSVSMICVGFVLLVIILYFRSLIAVTYIFFPTLLGVAAGFACTQLKIGYLNTNTAFLGPIILGNGINFGIILLARYQEERAQDQSIEDALAKALARTWHPTLIAAVAASIAYASLSIMHFRGFSQFGFIGGTGMALCWLATYTYGPALILFVERFRKRKVGAVARRRAIVPTFLARGLLKFPRLMLAISAIATVLAVIACVKIVQNPFDYDMRRLGSTHSVKDGASEWYARAGRIWGKDISPIASAVLDDKHDATPYRTALLVRDCQEGETFDHTALSQDPAKLLVECRRRVAAKEKTGGMLQEAANVMFLLPGEQEQKLAIVRQIWALLDDPAMKHLSPEQQKEIDDWAPPRDLRVLTPEDLPDDLVRTLRARDGSLGRVVMIFPAPGHFEGWDGHVLIRLAKILKGVELPDGRKVDAIGFAQVFAAMLRSIAADGPEASLIALILVCVLVAIFLLRPSAIALVLGSLLIGVAWMAGAADELGLRFNFLSFVAVPVTLGIGVDYAVNVYARLRVEPLENFARALGETGSAVALCSTTTIIGYSSLLTADSGALRSLGKVANLGEIGCLLAALLVVPAVLTLARRKRGDGSHAG